MRFHVGRRLRKSCLAENSGVTGNELVQSMGFGAMLVPTSVQGKCSFELRGRGKSFPLALQQLQLPLGSAKLFYIVG